MSISRRGFLQSASASLGATLLDRNSFASDDLEPIFTEIRANLLEMINEERAVAKLNPLLIDELATQVATRHAQEMAVEDFASHWGRDGRKPYHRYSFAGGTQATQENVSAADNAGSMKLSNLKQDAAYLHVRLYQEKPPYDGHRRAILAPQHTHVGFGIAVEKLRLRMVELFVAKYLQVEPIRRKAKPGDRLTFSAKLPKEGYDLNSVEVFYEPLPAPPEMSWLRQPRSYSLPNESKVLRPNVPLGGKFTTPIKLFRSEPGIYTIVSWLTRNSGSQKPFPATEVCIEAS
ncbi:MAG TPA: CAP domain-containing protein [Pyrinomonadaceae bacterium]|jgi:uncharacterized protein YkwD|nr:CAP domain-containing protein [Pyrinomonadaceae bacterium]